MRFLREKVFIGVDGGGTSTAAIAITKNGKVLGRTVGEQSNYHISNMDTARTNLTKTVHQLMEKCQLEDYECISIGMSSLDYKPTREFINSFVDGIFPSEKVEMHSDVYMALMGMTLGEPGVMIVSGTGSIGMAVDQAGKVYIVGGWGYLLRDEGSAYDMAMQGINAALKSFEGIGEAAILEKKVLDFFGADTHRQLIDIFYNPPISPSKVAGFGREVIEIASKGDKAAAAIVDNAVKALVNYACRLAEKVGSEDCIIGMYGSVLQKNPNIADAFKEQIHAVYPNTRIGFPDLKPEIGAVLYAMKRRGYPLNAEIIDKLKEQR